VLEQQVKDPKKMSTFIEDIMDPYGNNENRINESEKTEAALAFLLSELNKTKLLVKDSIEMTDRLYDKIEKGEKSVFSLNHFPNVINLFNGKNKKTEIDNIRAKAEELCNFDEDDNENDNENDEKRSLNHSDSSNSLMDFSVVGENDNDIKNDKE
jgi:hypothetical protein